MYTVEFSKEAEKFLDKQRKDVKERLIRATERLQVRPYAHISRLVNSPYWKFRVGDYRLLMRIEDDVLLVLVIEIGHRKNIYK